jgi:hypothetical protein
MRPSLRQRFLHSRSGQRAITRLGSPLLAIALVGLSAGCTERRPAADSYPLPLSSPEALRNPPEQVPEDLQEVRVVVANGGFDADRYAVQTRPVLMWVTTRGGPYTLSIERLVPRRMLPADTTTHVGFTPAAPGDYTMTLSGPGGSGTAVLNVRPAGGR